MRAHTIHRILPAAAFALLVVFAARAPGQESPATGLLGGRPVAFFSGRGKAYAVDPAARAVLVYDAEKRTTLRVPVGPAPVSLAVDESSNRIYVANSGGDSISVIDGTSDAVTAEIKVGPRPYAIAVNPATGRIYVSNTFSDVVSVIDARNTVTPVKAGSADAISVDSKLDRVYLLGYESNNLTVLDQSGKIVSKLPAGMHLWGMTVNERTHTLYAGRYGSAALAVLEEGSGTVRTVPVGAIPCAVEVNAVTNRVYVVNHGDDSVTVIDGANSTVIGTVAVGRRPLGIAVDERQNVVYVANVNGHSVTVIDGGDNRVRETLQTGRNPYALAVNPGKQLFVALEKKPALEVIDLPRRPVGRKP